MASTAVAVGTLVAAVAATVVLAGTRHDPPEALRPVATRTVAARAAAAPPARAAAPALPSMGPLVRTPARLLHVRPVEVAIPAVGIRSPLVDLTLDAYRTLRPPTDYDRAGWYAGGPYPGDAHGPPAVIAGHVDSWEGPAVFFPLQRIRTGQQIRVRRGDGSVAVFVVYATHRYPKDEFPADKVYRPTDRAELRVITCTGSFDENRRSYTDNLVVSAILDPAASESAP